MQTLLANVVQRLASCKRWLEKGEDKPEQSLKEYLEATHTRMPVPSPDDLLDIPSMKWILEKEVMPIATVADLDAMKLKWLNAKTQFDEFVAGCKVACKDLKRHSTSKATQKRKNAWKETNENEKKEQAESKAEGKGKVKKAIGRARWELNVEKLTNIEGIELVEEKKTGADVNWATPWVSRPDATALTMADAKVKDCIDEFASTFQTCPDFNKTQRSLAHTMAGKGKEEVDTLFMQVGPENIDVADFNGARTFLGHTWLVGVGEKMEHVDWNNTGAGQIRILADGGQVFLVMLSSNELLEALDKKGITLTVDGLKEYFMQGTLDKLTAMAEDCHVWYHHQSKGQTVYVPPGFLTIEGLSSGSSASIFSKRYFPKDKRCKSAYEGYKKLRENSKMNHERAGTILALYEKLQ